MSSQIQCNTKLLAESVWSLILSFLLQKSSRLNIETQGQCLSQNAENVAYCEKITKRHRIQYQKITHQSLDQYVTHLKTLTYEDTRLDCSADDFNAMPLPNLD